VLRRLKKAFDCKPDQIKADPKQNWYRLARKNIAQQVVHGAEC